MKPRWQQVRGKVITFRGPWEVQEAVVAGIDPVKGITILRPENGSLSCITPNYFGAGYAGAFLEALRELEEGFFDPEIIDKYATQTYHGGHGNPTCPFA